MNGSNGRADGGQPFAGAGAAWAPKTFQPVLVDQRTIGRVVATVEAYREERGSVFYVDCRARGPGGEDVCDPTIHVLRDVRRPWAAYKAVDIARAWYAHVEGIVRGAHPSQRQPPQRPAAQVATRPTAAPSQGPAQPGEPLPRGTAE